MALTSFKKRLESQPFVLYHAKKKAVSVPGGQLFSSTDCAGILMLDSLTAEMKRNQFLLKPPSLILYHSIPNKAVCCTFLKN